MINSGCFITCVILSIFRKLIVNRFAYSLRTLCMRRLILVQAHHEYPDHNNFQRFHISFPKASAAQSFSSSPLRNIFRIRMVFFIRRKNRLAYKKYKITDITKCNVCLTKIFRRLSIFT